MSDALGLKTPITTSETATVTTLDERRWQAWVARGRARDRQGRDTQLKALKWVSIVAVLAMGALWSDLTFDELALRCILTAAGIGMMFEAFRIRQYAFVMVFAALAALYNPIAPVFSLAGNWQRALVAVSAIPFVISLAWRDRKAVRID